MNLSSRHLALLGSIALALLASCSAAPEGEEAVATSTESNLSTAERMPRYQRIKDVAAARGLRNKAFLLAGIARHESGMAMCWSEASQHCRGPSSPECGGGPVMAGSGDGACSSQAGGLGMFQFDAGSYADTTRTYGPGILTVEGQVSAAVDFVVRIVKISAYTRNAETDAKALAWINAFDIDNATLRDQWVRTVLRYYNGCPEGGSCWAPRYRMYNDAITQVLSDTGGTAFWASGPVCDEGGGGPIADKYRAIGGCRSPIGAAVSGEMGTPDGIGRYRVYATGSIYVSQRTPAHVVMGRIRDAWKEAGWEAGPLGYPISDEEDIPGGKKSVFEHGFITWEAATNTTQTKVQ